MTILIQAKLISLFEDLKGKYPEGTQSFGQAVVGLHGLKMVQAFVMFKCLVRLLVEIEALLNGGGLGEIRLI
jgi:hypothetical protein